MAGVVRICGNQTLLAQLNDPNSPVTHHDILSMRNYIAANAEWAELGCYDDDGVPSLCYVVDDSARSIK